MDLTNAYGQLNTMLDLASGSREVSLLIARDDDERELYYHVLRIHGFEKADTIHDLAELLKDQTRTPRKYLYLADPAQAKELHDFVTQYPTGQVELFDREAMESTVVAPNYDILSLVIVMTQADLATIEQHGFALRAATGLTFTR